MKDNIILPFSIEGKEMTNHDPIWMIALVGDNFSSNRKTFYAKVKIWTSCTLNTNFS